MKPIILDPNKGTWFDLEACKRFEINESSALIRTDGGVWIQEQPAESGKKYAPITKLSAMTMFLAAERINEMPQELRALMNGGKL